MFHVLHHSLSTPDPEKVQKESEKEVIARRTLDAAGGSLETAGMDTEDTRTDAELVAAASAGEEAAFETLYRRYRDWVFGLARRFCNTDEDAADVVQETFCYLFNKFPDFTLRAQLKTFLYPVTKHRALNRVRSEKRTMPLGDADKRWEAAAVRDAAAERRSIVEWVGRLPGPQREVVLLRFADGLDLSEIAGALEIPVGTVKSRLHNALAVLREHPDLQEKA
jgi:RNA polymerase sigma-70 factor (ECF subfamily)